jgi:hypothetical protein
MVVQRRVTPKRRVRRPAQSAAKPFDIFEYLIERAKSIPAKELARMPRDGAKNLDHYLDGSPKQD